MTAACFVLRRRLCGACHYSRPHLLVVSYALGQGWRSALPIAAGVALGDFTAMTLSMLGVGALLLASSIIFTALKWVGAIRAGSKSNLQAGEGIMAAGWWQLRV